MWHSTGGWSFSTPGFPAPSVFHSQDPKARLVRQLRNRCLGPHSVLARHARASVSYPTKWGLWHLPRGFSWKWGRLSTSILRRVTVSHERCGHLVIILSVGTFCHSSILRHRTVPGTSKCKANICKEWLSAEACCFPLLNPRDPFRLWDLCGCAQGKCLEMCSKWKSRNFPWLLVTHAVFSMTHYHMPP